jgi:uncharacterized protein YggT (Ycf19 family)
MLLFYNASAIAAFYCALVNGFIVSLPAQGLLCYSTACLVAACCAACWLFTQLYTALYYVPFYLMLVRSALPVCAGIDLFPAVCLLVLGLVVVAILTSRLGHFCWAIWLGPVVATVGCGLFVLFDKRTAKAVFAVALAVFGMGNRMVLMGVNVGT